MADDFSLENKVLAVVAATRNSFDVAQISGYLKEDTEAVQAILDANVGKFNVIEKDDRVSYAPTDERKATHDIIR